MSLMKNLIKILGNVYLRLDNGHFITGDLNEYFNEQNYTFHFYDFNNNCYINFKKIYL